MAKSGDGAKGAEKKPPKCLICNKEIKRNGDGSIADSSKYCMEETDLIQCPNKGKNCKNKNDDNTRKGCDGYLRGSVGFGMMLGSNILVHQYKLTREGYDSISYHASKMGGTIKENYKKAALESFNKTLENIDDVGLKNKLMETEIKQIEHDIENVRIQPRDCHPLYVNGNIQAHHLICSEAMNNQQWRELCKITGYNINCRLNGIYMTSLASLACYLGIQRHRGPHDLGRGQDNEGIWKSYVGAVMAKINEVADSFEAEDCKEKSIKKFMNEMNNISKEICGKLTAFSWSIAWDGYGYNPAIRPHIGCANVEKVGDKRKVLKSVVKDLVDWENLTPNDMLKILDLPEDARKQLACTPEKKKEHKKEFKEVKKRVREKYKFKVGY